MQRFALIVICSLFVVVMMVPLRKAVAQRPEKPKWQAPPPSTQPSSAVYNPYPTGILPADLTSEIARVRSEVLFIETEAIAQWQALTPPTLTGQPPTLQGTGQRANVLLGKLMNFDENMSPFKNRA